VTETAVRTWELRRTFTPRRGEPREALKGLDLTIGAGEIHGLLGPNGAGKTTLVRILSTVLLPTAGRAEVLGLDVVGDRDQVRTRIGTVFGGERGLYSRVSVRRNMLFWASLYGLDRRAARTRSDALLERMGLTGRADTPVEELSRGMVQRVHLARGLIGDPRVLFLDEPTTGLDPGAALEFRSFVTELAGEGRTILLTTHDLAEAEAICARVSLIDQGSLIMSSDVRDVGRRLASADRVDFGTAVPEIAEKLGELPSVTSVTGLDAPDRYRAHPRSAEDVGEVIRFLVDHGVHAISTSPPTLEEVYLHLLGDRGLAL